jgi:hypothetical protein
MFADMLQVTAMEFESIRRSGSLRELLDRRIYGRWISIAYEPRRRWAERFRSHLSSRFPASPAIELLVEGGEHFETRERVAFRRIALPLLPTIADALSVDPVLAGPACRCDDPLLRPVLATALERLERFVRMAARRRRSILLWNDDLLIRRTTTEPTWFPGRGQTFVPAETQWPTAVAEARTRSMRPSSGSSRRERSCRSSQYDARSR